MQSTGERIKEGKPILPGAPKTNVTFRFRVDWSKLFKRKPEMRFVLTKEWTMDGVPLGVLYYYGWMRLDKSTSRQNVWQSKIEHAYRYTKKGSKNMCEHLGCKFKKL